MMYWYKRLTYISFLFIILLLQLFFHPTLARAEGEEFQNPFSDYVPFEDEYDVDEDERFMYFGRFFAISLGTGAQVFGGNIGKVYNTALPVFDFRLLYFFDFRFAGQVGVNSASHSYDSLNNGFVDVNLFKINVDLKYYIQTQNLSAAVTASNPYLIGGISQVYRTQVNQTLNNNIQKDNALGYSLGGGLEFALKPRKTSIGIEARYHQIFFKDRDSDAFASIGAPDMTGPMFSFLTTILFFF